MDSSSKFFFSFSVNYAMIVKLIDLIVLLGSKLLNVSEKFSTSHTKLACEWLLCTHSSEKKEEEGC